MESITEDMIVDYIVNDIQTIMNSGASKEDAIEQERYHLDVIIDMVSRKIEE